MKAWLTSCVALVGAMSVLAACAHAPPTIPPVAQVDLSRFMGRWYVIAHIPTRFEREAFAATETYVQAPDGRIETTFAYRKGALDGPERTMHPIARVRPGTGNAVWDMRFFGIFDAEYVIADLDEQYSVTVIARSSRDYAWIMARTPSISPAALQGATDRLRALGYSLENLREVPQPRHDPDAAP